MVLLMQLSTALLADHAANRVAEALDAEYWAEAVQFFADNPDSTAWGIEEFTQYAEYLRRAEVYTYAPEGYEDEFRGPTADLVFCSPLSLSLLFNPGRLLPNFNILSLDLTEEMDAITIPTLLAWCGGGIACRPSATVMPTPSSRSALPTSTPASRPSTTAGLPSKAARMW